MPHCGVNPGHEHARLYVVYYIVVMDVFQSNKQFLTVLMSSVFTEQFKLARAARRHRMIYKWKGWASDHAIVVSLIVNNLNLYHHVRTATRLFCE